jgi:hypothetical protein
VTRHGSEIVDRNAKGSSNEVTVDDVKFDRFGRTVTNHNQTKSDLEDSMRASVIAVTPDNALDPFNSILEERWQTGYVI